MMKKRKMTCNSFVGQRGQVVVEYILLMVLLFSLTLIVFKGFDLPFNKFVNRPKELFQGLSRSGSWIKYEEARPGNSPDLDHHPAKKSHHLQVEGRTVR